jgi:hypothetical protein
MKVVWIVLAVLTVVGVAVGAWFFVRDEYPFQGVGDDDVVALIYEQQGDDGPVVGYVDDPPDELGGWIRGWERDTSGEAAATSVLVTVLLRDGRALRLDVGGDATQRGYAAWVATDGRPGESLAVHFNDAFIWYLGGLRDGLLENPGPLPGQESPSSTPAATPTATPAPTPTSTPAPTPTSTSMWRQAPPPARS